MDSKSVTPDLNDADIDPKKEMQIDERQLRTPVLSTLSIGNEENISDSDFSTSDSDNISDPESNDEIVYIFDGFSITPQKSNNNENEGTDSGQSQSNANPTNKILYSGNTTFEYAHETNTTQALNSRNKHRSHQSDISTELDSFLHGKERNFHFVMFSGINEKMSRFTLRFQNDELEKQYFLNCFRSGAKNGVIILLCGIFFAIYAFVFLIFKYPIWHFIMLLIDSIGFFCMGVVTILIRRRERNWVHYYSFKWSLALNAVAVGMTLAVLDGWAVSQYGDDQFTAGVGVVCYFVTMLISFDYPYKLRQFPTVFTMLGLIVLCVVPMVMRDEIYPGIILNLVGTALVLLLTLAVGYRQEFNKRQSMLFQLYLQKERAKSEELLFNMLPAPVVNQLKEMTAGPLSPETSQLQVTTPKTPGLQTPKDAPKLKFQESTAGIHLPIRSYTQHTVAEYYEEVSVLFCEITKFSKLASLLSPEHLVDLLNDVYSVFDQLTEKHGVYKIENIGPVYMVAGGCPVPSTDHAQRLALLAVDMMKYAQSFGTKNLNFNLRIGINTGPVRAGVVGTKSLSFKLFGDTVNTAARMESYSAEGRITLSPITRQRLLDTTDGIVKFIIEGTHKAAPPNLQDRGLINVKGKGDMNLYFLNDVQGAEGVYLTKNPKFSSANEIASLYETLEAPLPLQPWTLQYTDKAFAESHPTTQATFVTSESFTFLRKFVSIIIIFDIYASMLLEDDSPNQIATAVVRGLSLLSVIHLLIITVNAGRLRKCITKYFQFVITDLYVVLIVCETASCILTQRADIYLFMVSVIVPLIHAVPGYDYRYSAVVTCVNWIVWVSLYPLFTTDWFVVNIAAVTLVKAVSAALSYSRCYNERMNYYLNDLVESERRQTDAMLTSMLPAPVVQRLKNGATAICDEFHSVSILYSDIVSFTNMASKIDPKDLVVILNQLYTAFDYLTEKHKVFKLEIIGDTYTAVSGIDSPSGTSNHAKSIVLMALDMIQAITKLKTPPGVPPIRMRFGVHSGKIVGGIVGLKKFRYHAWGSDVIIANFMESNGVPNQVVVSQETKDLLKDDSMFHFQFYQEIQMGELGKVNSYLVDWKS